MLNKLKRFIIAYLLVPLIFIGITLGVMWFFIETIYNCADKARINIYNYVFNVLDKQKQR